MAQTNGVNGNAPGYLSADDFLTAIMGESDDMDVPGIGIIRIRALTLAEVDAVRRRATGKKGDDPDAGKLMAWSLYYGMVEPKLPEAAVEKLLTGSAGKLTKVARRIMAISGLGDSEEADPLAGAGS